MLNPGLLSFVLVRASQNELQMFRSFVRVRGSLYINGLHCGGWIDGFVNVRSFRFAFQAHTADEFGRLFNCRHVALLLFGAVAAYATFVMRGIDCDLFASRQRRRVITRTCQ